LLSPISSETTWKIRQEVAKNSIDPKRVHLVAAGAIDKDGKEIKKGLSKPEK
jgi:hypothetical protein